VSTDRESGWRLRQAYGEAWADRRRSGDGDEVLRARLRAHQLDEVLDETTPIHRHVFDLWGRGVPPDRLDREAWKLAGRAALQLITTGRSLLQTFRPAGSEEEQAMAHEADLLEEMPEDKEGVLDNYNHPASASLSFELAESAAPLLRRYARLTRGRDGWHSPSVWFDMLPDQPRAYVLLGSTVIGEAQVPVEIWRPMRDVAGESLYADGFLEFRTRNDDIETGTLICYYATDPPGPPAAGWTDRG
jgi:hypothetical protein